MLNILICSKSGEITETQEISKLKAAFGDPELHLWVDMEDPNDEEIDLLLEVFHFHPLAIEDVIMDISMPKMDMYDTYAFLNLHRVFYNFETETCERRDFEVFFSEKFIITVHEHNLSRTFAATRERIKENPKRTLGEEPCYVLLKLLELAVKDYQPVMQEWQDTLEDIEQRVLKGGEKQEDRILDHILKFKKLVATMRKSLLPEREVIKQLYENPSLSYISKKARPYFKSAIDDFNSLMQDLENLREHAGAVFDVYAAVLTIKMTESSNKLNFVMQRLTIAATIFLPLTFIVGLYGMNFKDMPEYQWEGFYYILLGGMLVLVTGMVWFFKRKKWL
jgi:magnesium transporter